VTNPNSSSIAINTVTPSGDFSVSSDGCSGTNLGPSANCVVGASCLLRARPVRGPGR
jgi:hypothetical protein